MATKGGGQAWGEGTIRERTNRDGVISYQARYWEVIPGRVPKQRSKTFPTRDGAEDFLRETMRAKRDDKYRSPSSMTLSDLITEHIDRSSTRLSARTVLTYRQRQRKMIDPTIGTRRLTALTPLDLQRWIDGLSRQKFSPSTIHAAVAVVMSALREAALLGITDRHLGTGIRRPSLGKPRSTTWTEAQVKQVLAATRDDELYGALYHVAIVTGMRPGELRALMWDCVDLDRGVIIVRRTITRNEAGEEIIGGDTKTGKDRVIAIAASVVARLKWHRARQRERQLASERWEKMNLVFDSGSGHWLWQSAIKRYQDDLCERLEIPKIRLHDIRHTTATLLVEQNIHAKVISDILGHSSIDITMDRYSHPSTEVQRLALNRLSDLVDVTEDAG